jgi:hypothetical protein
MVKERLAKAKTILSIHPSISRYTRGVSIANNWERHVFQSVSTFSVPVSLHTIFKMDIFCGKKGKSLEKHREEEKRGGRGKMRRIGLGYPW